MACNPSLARCRPSGASEPRKSMGFHQCTCFRFPFWAFLEMGCAPTSPCSDSPRASYIAPLRSSTPSYRAMLHLCGKFNPPVLLFHHPALVGRSEQCSGRCNPAGQPACATPVQTPAAPVSCSVGGCYKSMSLGLSSSKYSSTALSGQRTHSHLGAGYTSRSLAGSTVRLRRMGGRHPCRFAPDKAADTDTGSRDESVTYAPGECIEVSESFQASEGAQLSADIVIDKHIGSGSTADVYKLKRVSPGSNGQQQCVGDGQVLKWSKPLPGARLAFQREWMLGRRLNAAARQDPALNLLLQTGPAVVSYTSKQELVFRGTVLEGLIGKSLDKRLEEDPSFCDIDFLLACLQQVMTALDQAEDLVGFRHGDLRVSNIMEHVLDPAAYEDLLQNPDTWRSSGHESAAGAALAKGIMTLKLLDWGHSDIHESSSRRVLLSVEQDKSTAHDQYIISSSGRSGSSLALQRLPPSKGLIEAVYRFWYKDKSDAWRLFHSLAPRLDGRAWPERKRERVLAFYKLVSDLQDVKLEAKFFDDTTVGADGQPRRLDSSEPVFDKDAGQFVKLSEMPGQDVTAKPRRWKLLRAIRDFVLRGWSRWFSRRKRVSFKHVLKKMRRRGLLVLPDGGK